MEKNEDIDFVILNKNRYEELNNIPLTCCFLIHESDKGNMRDWMCETRNGHYLRIHIIAGMISMKRAETENEVIGNAGFVLKPVIGLDNKEDLRKCKFSDIKKFMKWRINKDNYIE
tara:strand:+ start:3357 stop:3704 length:348 start_codon:yes stop_codon:yes gene_type:complete